MELYTNINVGNGSKNELTMDIVYLPMPPMYPFEGSECFHHIISDVSDSDSIASSQGSNCPSSEDTPHFFRSMAEAFRHVQQKQNEHGVVMQKRDEMHQHESDKSKHHSQNENTDHDGHESQESRT